MEATTVTADGALASRAEVLAMTRVHLVPLAAMGVAAADAVTTACDWWLAGDPQAQLLRPKVEGLWTTALWTESVRAWVASLTDPPVRLHDPYKWVELVFHERLHMRMHRERPWRPNSSRGEYFQMQLPSPELELAIESQFAGNIELIAHPGPGKAPLFRVHARIGTTELWEPITIDPVATARQLSRWQAKDVPWVRVADRLKTAMSATDLRHLIRPAGPDELPAREQHQEPSFTAYPRAIHRHTDEGRPTS